MQWYRLVNESDHREKLFNGNKMISDEERIIVVVDARRWSTELKIIGATLHDAGKYFCEESGTLAVASTNVVIMGKQTITNIY